MPRAKMEKLTPDSSINVQSCNEISEPIDSKTDASENTSNSDITNEPGMILEELLEEEQENTDPDRFLVKVSIK